MTALLSKDSRLRDLPNNTLLILATIITIGASLRICYQLDRPFTGDEVGTLLNTAQGFRFLLSRFGGWLTMNYYIILIKCIGAWTENNAWALVMPSLLAGVITIVLVAALCVRLSSNRTALLAAFFVSVNPYLVFHSVQIRSYMLLTAFSLGSLIYFYDWCNTSRWHNGIGCAACGALALLSHANAVYQLGFIGFLFIIWIGQNRIKILSLSYFRRTASFIVPMIVSLSLVGVAYLPLLKQMKYFRKMWTDIPPTGLDYLPFMFNLFFVKGFFVLPTLLLLAFGLWVASQHNHRLMLLALGIVLPISFASMLGVSHYPWAYARFFIPILPLMLVFIAEGTDYLTKLYFHFRGWLLVLLILASWTPHLQELFTKKHNYPYIKVADYLKNKIQHPDVFLPIDFRARHNLRPYFERKQFIYSATEYLNQRNMPNSTYRLFVVSEDAPIKIDTSQHTIGMIKIVRYTGNSRTEIAKMLLDDLRTSLNKQRISPKLIGQYSFLLELMSALSITDEKCKYVSLYYKCLKMTLLERFMPLQFVIPRDERDYKWFF
jgi:4-amino-4-deoxy-L-arabinose transferase-like glycosyltransferase